MQLTSQRPYDKFEMLGFVTLCRIQDIVGCGDKSIGINYGSTGKYADNRLRAREMAGAEEKRYVIDQRLLPTRH